MDADPDLTVHFTIAPDRDPAIRVQKLSYTYRNIMGFWCWRHIFLPPEIVFVKESNEADSKNLNIPQTTVGTGSILNPDPAQCDTDSDPQHCNQANGGYAYLREKIYP